MSSNRKRATDGRRHAAASVAARPGRSGAATSTAVADGPPPGTGARAAGVPSGPAPTTVERLADPDAPAGPASWVPWFALVLSVLGLADAGYLTYVHFNPGALVCSTNSVFNCAQVQTSPQSMVFGVIPVAILGLAYFVPMTVVNLPPLWRAADIRVVWLRLALVVVGMGMVVYLVIAELFQIKAICEYCTGIHVVTFALFVTTVLTYPALSYRARWLTWTRSGGTG